MAKSTLAWKGAQWIIRALQAACAAVVLGVTSYFMGTKDNRDLAITKWERAVTGISGAALVWILFQILLLCCIAGFFVTSGLTILVDLLFIAAFIYVAWAHRNGARSCSGSRVRTPFGRGPGSRDVADFVGGNIGWTKLPTFNQACLLQRACLSVAIIAAFLFLVSMFLEYVIVRSRRKHKHDLPSTQTGSPLVARGKGLLNFRRNRARGAGVARGAGNSASDTARNVADQARDATREADKNGV